MNPRHILACAALAGFFLFPAAHPAAAAVATRPAFEAHSELFELVGRITNERLTLTLDRWASNAPVNDARIEIEVGGKPLLAEAQPDGTYVLNAAPFAAPGTYPLTILIDAGDESDLLATDFVIGEETVEAANDTGAGIAGRTVFAATLMLALLAAAGFVFNRRRGARA
ncbi:MAG: hypothetical protein RBT86_02795 [Azospira sp.]|jgi:hypothetical protein|nr:hypothetical protein [Azospira sp.]